VTGAVSLMAATVPAGWTVAFCRCTQKASTIPAAVLTGALMVGSAR
jgi:hypothetical protein